MVFAFRINYMYYFDEKYLQEDNERLSNAIQTEKDSKIKLQTTMDDFKIDSKTMLLEQDKKTKEILEENASLKERLKKLEKQLLEEMNNAQRQTKRVINKR